MIVSLWELMLRGSGGAEAFYLHCIFQIDGGALVACRLAEQRIYFFG
jgi:hypothetical protein